MPRTHRHALATAIVLIFGLLISTSATAATTATLTGTGTLKVAIDSATPEATLTCSGGTVFLNGNSTGISCANVKRIEIEGSPVADQITVTAVNAASFTQAPDIFINARGGEDVIELGLSSETVNGGPGHDHASIIPIAATTIEVSNTKIKMPGDPTSIASIELIEATLPAGGNTFDASGFDGDLTVTGGSGADLITGGHGNDLLYGEGGADIIQGGGKGDDISGGPGNDDLFGGPGIDWLIFSMQTTNISISDLVANSATTGVDDLGGFEGIEIGNQSTALASINLSGFSGRGYWVGSTGNDTISGTQGGTLFLPGPGDDSLTGNAPAAGFSLENSDVFYTQISGAATYGAGSSTSSDGADNYNGIDLLVAFGGVGNENVNAIAFPGLAGFILGQGSDTVLGSPQDDLFSVDGNDIFDGNGGFDSIGNYTYYNEQVLTDTGYSGPSFNVSLQEVEFADLQAADGSFINASAWTGKTILSGLAGNEMLTGGMGRDLIFGAGGNDRLRGGPSPDRISGQGGNDRMNGGPASDTCNGGTGRDRAKACEKGKLAPTLTADVDVDAFVDRAEALRDEVQSRS